jgi:hypothetical protein
MLYEIITGKEFEFPEDGDIDDRIARSLLAWKLGEQQGERSGSSSSSPNRTL